MNSLIKVPTFSNSLSEDNKIIHGDNLLILDYLQKDYFEKIKLIYVDPPYNTGNFFKHYDDKLHRIEWLDFMEKRLNLLKNLMKNDGVIFVQINDNESAYLKILMDKIFGEENYETTLYIQVRYLNKTLTEDNSYHKVIEQILIYKKPAFKPNKKKIDYPLDKFCWEINELTNGKVEMIDNKKVIIFKEGEYEINKVPASINALKETWATGSLVRQGGSAAEFFDKYLSNRKEIDGLKTLYKVINMGTKGDGLGYRYITGPRKISASKGKFYYGIPLKKINEIKSGNPQKEIPIPNFYDFSGSFGNCRLEGGLSFNGGKKPEALISMILEIGSNPEDLILDPFLGSGTTAAVAHKMNRKYIGIEKGNQIITHCIPRLKNISSNFNFYIL